MRDAFNFYRSFYDAAMELEDSERLVFYDMIINFQLFGKEPTLKDLPKMVRLCWLSQKYVCEKQLKGYLRAKNINTSELEAPSGGNLKGNPKEEKEKEKEKDKKIFFPENFNDMSFLLKGQTKDRAHMFLRGKFPKLNDIGYTNLLKEFHLFALTTRKPWIDEANVSSYFINWASLRKWEDIKQPAERVIFEPMKES